MRQYCLRASLARQNWLAYPGEAEARNAEAVITYPLMTKKTSTPIHPAEASRSGVPGIIKPNTGSA